MSKYIVFFKNYIETALEYRFNQFTYLFLEFIGFGGTIIFWLAVFREQGTVADLTLDKAIGYYLLVIPVGFLTSVVISDKLAPEIRMGDFSNHLLKPYRLWLVYFIDAVTRQIFWASLVLPFFVILWLAFFSVKVPINFGSLLLGIGFIILGFLMQFFLDLFISLLAFWFDDVWSFAHLKRILFMVLGGSVFPFSLLSAQFRQIVEVMPFKYFYYLPVVYIQKQRPPIYLINDLFGVVIWITIFVCATSIVWRRGIKNYGAYGR